MKNLRIGGTDVNEYIKEQIAIEISKQNKEKTYSEMYESLGLHDRIANQNGEIIGLRRQVKESKEGVSKAMSGLHAKIKELEEDIGVKGRLLSELQLPAKWYENIPEQGVLCWCGDYGNEHFTDRNVHNIVSVSESSGQFLTQRGTPWKIAVPLTNEEIEEFKR
jgi:hypothetical protein